MKNYPREKYKIFVGPNKVVAVSTYAGRKVRGVAKCAPEDAFDVEKGKNLAIARCALKIAEKRLKRANKKAVEAKEVMIEARNHFNRMESYLADSIKDRNDAIQSLQEIEDSL